MPHGKNNSKKRVNAKKKGQRDRGSSAPPPSLVGVGGTTTANDVPSLRSFRSDGPTPSSQPLDTTHESLYIRYKRSTKRFKEALQAMVPPDIFQTDNVDALMEATDYVVENDLTVDDQLLADLKLSIRVRKRMAKDKFSGGDQGHSHFIAVLAYCWSHLHSRRSISQTTIPSTAQQKADIPYLCNRFDGFSTDNDNQDEDDDEGDLPSTPQPRPVETGPIRLTLDELIHGNNNYSIALFLSTLDELMRHNSLRFSELKDVAARIAVNKWHPSAMIGSKMEAAVGANFAIEQVIALEQAFLQDHPHLTTVYRVLANLVLVREIQELTALVTEKSPIASQFSETDAVAFVGDVVESAFRDLTDPQNKYDSLVSDFLKQWQFQEDISTAEECLTVQAIFIYIRDLTMLEVAMAYQQSHDEWDDAVRSLGRPSHSWLPHDYIGTNRSITHTIRLVQEYSCFIEKHQGRVLFQKGSFGSVDWGSRTVPATRIQIDMDELLFGDVMPALVNMCYKGLMSFDIPHQKELFTGFVQVKSFVKHPERPLSWALAFTIHTILTAIFEVQGQLAKVLASEAKRAFERFFEQLDVVEKRRRNSGLEFPPLWDTDMKMVQSLRHLVFLKIRRTPEQTLLSVWNPYCAGVQLLYIAYYGNLDGGTRLADWSGQLRTTLHLFNALKQVGAINQCPVLDLLLDDFKHYGSIWKGQPPKQGQFRSRWWSSIGVQDGVFRAIPAIAFDQYSNGFRRICLRDGRGVFDKCKVGILDRENKSYNPLYKYVMRVHAALTSMSNERHLLASNLICLGFFLNDFYHKLFRDWGLMAMVDEMVCKAAREIDHVVDDENSKHQCLKHQFMSHLFADMVLSPLESGDKEVAPRCAKIVIDYFSKLSPRDFMWFVPIVES